MTNEQVARRNCFRCKKRKGHAVWSICADGNKEHVICKPCDLELNNVVLAWMRHPRARSLMRAYRKLLG